MYITCNVDGFRYCVWHLLSYDVVGTACIIVEDTHEIRNMPCLWQPASLHNNLHTCFVTSLCIPMVTAASLRTYNMYTKPIAFIPQTTYDNVLLITYLLKSALHND